MKLSNKFKTPRKTQVEQIESIKEEKEIEYVEPEKCVVVITESGLIKRIPSSSFRKQRRNTKGVKTQDDITNMIIRTNTIDNLLIFTNKGKMYKLLVDNIPVGTNASQGKSIKGLVPMEAGEKPNVIYSIYRDTNAEFVLFTTKKGLVKKTKLEEFMKSKAKNGIQAIKIAEDDDLADVCLIKNENIIILSKKGKAIHCPTENINSMGKIAMGVKGINLDENDYAVSTIPIRHKEDDIAIFTTSGLGKRVSLADFPVQNRGGKGVRVSTEDIACGVTVVDNDELLVMGDKSNLCIKAEELPLLNRNSKGNIIIKDNHIIDVSKVKKESVFKNMVERTKSYNKILFIFFIYFFGYLGLDRFIRGQKGLGILKLITFGGFGIWNFIDFIIAIVKTCKTDGEYLIFENGKYIKY